MNIKLKYECVNKKNLNVDVELAILNKKIDIIDILMKKEVNMVEKVNSIFNTNFDENKLVDFIKLNEKSFDIIKQVYREQYMIINSPKVKCNNIYRVSMYNNDMLVISMFISVYPDIQSQMHFYIIKDILYLLNQYPNIKNSSILLHSFASDLFNSQYWCTSPLDNMKQILLKHGVVFRDDLVQGFMKRIALENVGGRRDKPLCFVRDYVNTCIDTNSIKSFWNKNMYTISHDIEKDNYLAVEKDFRAGIAQAGIPQDGIAQDGGYKYKYLKYKKKYLQYKKLI